MYRWCVFVCLCVASWRAASADVMPPERTHMARIGRNVVIKCTSNLDDEHVFMYWHIPKFNVVIGPRNRFNHVKYNYEAISGNLEIRGVTSSDKGIYTCVSEGIETQDIEIRNVKLEIIDGIPYPEKYQQDMITQEETEQYIWTAIIIFLVALTVGLIIYLGVFAQQQVRKNCTRTTHFDIENGCTSGVYNSTTATTKSSTESEQLYEQPTQQEHRVNEKPEEIKMLQHTVVIEV